MYVDAVTTMAVVEQLNDTILGGRVQAVIEVHREALGFEIYANGTRHYLLMNIEPQGARVHLVPDKLRRGVEHPSPLGLLLRKYIDGAHLDQISQPPWERVIHFDFSGPEGEYRMIAETMDKRSNVILINEGRTMDVLRRVGPDQNRYRSLLPGTIYVSPPPQEKIRPDRVTAEEFHTWLALDGETLAWRVLVRNIAGVSPMLAREVVHRATEYAEAPAFDVAAVRVYEVFAEMVRDFIERRWKPGVIVEPEAGGGFLGFAAYKVTYLGNWLPRNDISTAMVDYFGAPIGADAYAAARSTVRGEIDESLERMRRKLHSLKRQADEQADVEILRKKGELVLAYGPSLEPEAAQFESQYDPDGPTLTIKLDSDLTHVENAQRYFDRYEKAKRAADDIPKLVRRTQHEVSYLRQLAADLELAENWPEIDAVREAMQQAGYWRGPRQKGPAGGKPGIRRFTTHDGYVIFVGRNAGQNHQLVTERSGPDDLWLHARGIPGSHVIIRNDGRPIPDKVIEQAAGMAAYYSSAREDTSVEVDVTERRHVRPIKGGKPGMVRYKNERTLNIAPGLLGE